MSADTPRMPGSTVEDGRRIRRARWATYNPLELEKELALLKRSGCDPELIAETEAALVAKREECRLKYGNG